MRLGLREGNCCSMATVNPMHVQKFTCKCTEVYTDRLCTGTNEYKQTKRREKKQTEMEHRETKGENSRTESVFSNHLMVTNHYGGIHVYTGDTETTKT